MSFNDLCIIVDSGRGIHVCSEKIYFENMFIADKFIEATIKGCDFKFRQFQYTPEPCSPTYTPTWYDNWTWKDFDNHTLSFQLAQKNMVERGGKYAEWLNNLPDNLNVDELKGYGEWMNDIQILIRAKARYKKCWRELFPVEYQAFKDFWQDDLSFCDEKKELVSVLSSDNVQPTDAEDEGRAPSSISASKKRKVDGTTTSTMSDNDMVRRHLILAGL